MTTSTTTEDAALIPPTSPADSQQQPAQPRKQHDGHHGNAHGHHQHQYHFHLPEFLVKGDFSLDEPTREDAATAVEFEIPFITAHRSDRLGRMADWNGAGQDSGSGRRRDDYGAAGEDEPEGQWSFSSFVDARVSGGRRNSRSGPSTGGPSFANRPSGPRRQGWGPGGSGQARRIIREASRTVDPAWRVVDEVEFNRLSKLSFAPEDPVVLRQSGSVLPYDASLDRVTARQERSLGILENAPTPSPRPPIWQSRRPASTPTSRACWRPRARLHCPSALPPPHWLFRVGSGWCDGTWATTWCWCCGARLIVRWPGNRQ